jgi:ABC-type branched-subunit amino acid transport system substrate-binding protein
MGEHRGKWLLSGALAVVAAVTVAGCSSSTTSPTTTIDQQRHRPALYRQVRVLRFRTAGGDPTSINVGAISTLTGSIAADFNGLAPGVQAYFDMVNAEGGINGRKLNLAYNLDDGGSPASSPAHPHPDRPGPRLRGDGGLLLVHPELLRGDQDAHLRLQRERQLGQRPQPLRGRWQLPPGLRAAVPTYAYLLKQTHSKSVAVISYGPAITSSYDACNTAATDLAKNGYNVSYVDVGAQLGGSYSSAVQRMQQTGTDMIISCMQESDNITMARDIQQYGLKTKQLWLSGYDRSLLSQYSSLMQGVYFNNCRGPSPTRPAAVPEHVPGHGPT